MARRRSRVRRNPIKIFGMKGLELAILGGGLLYANSKGWLEPVKGLIPR